jgi:hypothetical protein
MKPLTTTFSYAQVESALMRARRVPPSMTAAFRARLSYFQRLGFAPGNPGKGRRIVYEREDVLKWAIALMLADFGLEPATAKSFLETHWRKSIGPGLESGRLLVFQPRLLTDRSHIKAMVIDQLSDLNIDRYPDGKPYSQSAIDENARFNAECTLVDLGYLRREVDAALAA